MEEGQIYYIYMHINKINGKIYIGQTKNCEKRWRCNGRMYKPKEGGQSRFWNAINKYGWNNFEHRVIMICNSREEANLIERKLIKEYKTQDENFGYNIADGGGSPCIYQNWTEEQKEQYRKDCSKRAKELWEDKDYREKHFQSMKKALNTKEHKELMSQIMRQRYSNPEEIEKQKVRMRQIKGTPIRCIETNQVFCSISEANEFLGKSLHSLAINDCLRGKSKTGHGYHWERISKEEYYAIVNKMESTE